MQACEPSDPQPILLFFICPQCQAERHYTLHRPETLDDFCARINGANVCHACGDTNLRIVTGKPYREALARFENKEKSS